MHTVHRTPAFTLTDQPVAALDADLLVAAAFEDGAGPEESALDEASGGQIGQARARQELTGKIYETFFSSVRRGGAMRRALLVGAGRRRDFTHNRLRRLAATAGLAARQAKLARVAVALPALDGLAVERALQSLAEGATLANFEGAAYKTGGQPPTFLDAVIVRVGGSAAGLDAAIERGRVLGECTNMARELANEPGNRLTPSVFADRAAAAAKAAGLTVAVLDEHEIARHNMGLLLGVARGSREPPRLVVLRYSPPGAADRPVLGLVGKGITFDTGGISIKPADNMDKMKDDMSGGAAVVGAMAAIARIGAPVRCIGVIPMTENMPGGQAVKPGDVLTSAAGKTVEVLNTDAEGRLVLGDAVWYARELGATHLVDVATLTGACVVALGKSTSGLFGTPAAWVETVRAATLNGGDRSWPLPIFEDYKEQFKSEIADFSNTGGRPAGAITGALFIREFAADLPWVHMDIAGTAWAEEAKPYQPKGATGVGVRTLAELALHAGSWSTLKMEPEGDSDV
jgi:leucyl aminopeptidase